MPRHLYTPRPPLFVFTVTEERNLIAQHWIILKRWMRQVDKACTIGKIIVSEHQPLHNEMQHTLSDKHTLSLASGASFQDIAHRVCHTPSFILIEYMAYQSFARPFGNR